MNLRQNEEQFFTEKEICKRLRVTLPTLKSMRDKGQIDYFRIGKNIRYPRHVFEGHLKMEGSNA